MSSLILNGQFLVPKNLINQKYKFKFENIESALLDLIGNQ
jgi:NAD dependent epimerase/dehydratase family enzyme